MADELDWGDSQSIDLTVEETVKAPISYYIGRFQKALIEKLAEDGSRRPVDQQFHEKGTRRRSIWWPYWLAIAVSAI